MDEADKARVREIATLCAELPDGLQQTAFELLLSDFLAARRPPTAARAKAQAQEHEAPTSPEPDPDVETKTGQDIQSGDVHLKAKKFLEKYQLTIGDLNQLFYKEHGQVAPLYEDLQTTKLSQMQLRIALLLALQRAIGDGEFVFSGEDVRDQCRARKCYDTSHFTRYFADGAEFFDGFDGYDKDTPEIKLSEAGRAELAELVKTLR